MSDKCEWRVKREFHNYHSAGYRPSKVIRQRAALNDYLAMECRTDPEQPHRYGGGCCGWVVSVERRLVGVWEQVEQEK